jgi:hypothetical protein
VFKRRNGKRFFLKYSHTPDNFITRLTDWFTALSDTLQYRDDNNQLHPGLHFAAATKRDADNGTEAYAIVVYSKDNRSRNPRYHDIDNEHPNEHPIVTDNDLRNKWCNIQGNGFSDVVGSFSLQENFDGKKRVSPRVSKQLEDER